MPPSLSGLDSIARIIPARSRSISAENPTGAPASGAQATPPGPLGQAGTDSWCTPAARDLGRGWKVRPCARDLLPGQTLVLADIEGPGVITHVWCTMLPEALRWIALRVFYDDQTNPAIECPLGDFFANGIDGNAIVSSIPVCVNPRGGMNSYWPMPFRRRVRVEITNDGPASIPEFFYQISYELREVPDNAGLLHAAWRRSLTTRDHPEHAILDLAGAGPGHYAGTYLVWNQLSNQWWGEGEVKFFIDDDPPDAPTICGTGTEDYFGGAWGFVMDGAADMRPTTYSTAYLGYPQAVYEATARSGPRVPAHALYRWHLPDPIRFQNALRVRVQALGWWHVGPHARAHAKFQPLIDDIASVAYWYQSGASPKLPGLPPIDERLPR